MYKTKSVKINRKRSEYHEMVEFFEMGKELDLFGLINSAVSINSWEEFAILGWYEVKLDDLEIVG